MAQSFQTDAGQLIIPQATSEITVQTANSGLATSGVLMLVGEADAGPSYDLESSLGANLYGPDQLSAVVAKYGSGPIVDAFRMAASASNDPNIVGSPSAIMIAKTNKGSKASSLLSAVGGGSFVGEVTGLALSLADQNYGKKGNLSYYTIASTAEVLPTTGTFTMLLPISSIDVGFRVNGGAEVQTTLTALETPAAMAAAIDALAGVAASGGTARGILGGVAGNLSITATGNGVVVAYTGTWAVTPTPGDTFYIPSTSPIKGGANQNVGSYVVTAATNNSVTATKLLDGSGAVGTLTPPVTVGSVGVGATTDVQAFAPVTITVEAGNPISGAGKALAILELATNTDRLANIAYVLGTTAKVSWIGTAALPTLLTSGTEYSVTVNGARQVDSLSEALSAGGEIALTLGYTGTTATVTITATTLTTSVVGGAGQNLNITLKDFPTISDLATYINSQPGYVAKVGTAILGQLPSVSLDNVTAVGICSQWGVSAPGRVKIDAYRFYNKISSTSSLFQLQDANGVVQQPNCGLPAAVANVTYLAGGTRGGTTDASVLNALAALEKVQGNFVIPLFSRDASADVTDGLTDATSTYTIAAVHANTRSHVLKMSTLKRRRNRQAFLSIRDTFANDKTTSANIASFRCSMCFEDVKTTDSSGAVVQAQPWMAAVNAAAMQAAGFYRGIVRKFAAINGAVQAKGDFDDQDDDAMEQALLAGLLPLRKAQTGGWYWVSDQTTYGKDSNFVFNSIQATYVADTIALTTALRMEQAFAGQSVADVSASLALAFLETIMGDFLRLKLIAASDDAPRGFKNASIKISGTAMIVNCEVKLAGLIYFIPISFLVSQVTQSA